MKWSVHKKKEIKSTEKVGNGTHETAVLSTHPRTPSCAKRKNGKGAWKKNWEAGQLPRKPEESAEQEKVPLKKTERRKRPKDTNISFESPRRERIKQSHLAYLPNIELWPETLKLFSMTGGSAKLGPARPALLYWARRFWQVLLSYAVRLIIIVISPVLISIYISVLFNCDFSKFFS